MSSLFLRSRAVRSEQVLTAPKASVYSLSDAIISLGGSGTWSLSEERRATGYLEHHPWHRQMLQSPGSY